MPDAYDDLIDNLGSPAKKAKAPMDYHALYQEVGKKHGVDPDLLYNQAKQESVNFNPLYVYGPGKSPKGAAGLSQFMPDTARQYGLYVGKGRDDRYNPRLAADAQARMMKDLIGKHGDATLALAAYNSGHNKTSEQARRSAQRIPETRGYVQKIAPKGDKYDQLLDGLGDPQSTAPKTAQADPYDALLDSLDTPAPKTKQPPITTALDKLMRDNVRRTQQLERRAARANPVPTADDNTIDYGNAEPIVPVRAKPRGLSDLIAPRDGGFESARKAGIRRGIQNERKVLESAGLPDTQNPLTIIKRLISGSTPEQDVEEQTNAKFESEQAANAERQRLIAQMTPADRAEIKDFTDHLQGKGRVYSGVRAGVRQGGSGGLYKLAGLADIANAIQKPLTGKDSWIPDYLKRKALAGELSVEDIPEEKRNQLAEFLAQSTVGLAEVAAAPGGAVSKFAGLAGTEAIGRGRPAREVAKETAKGATIGGVFKGAEGLAPEGAGLARRIATTAPAVGAGTLATETAFGTPIREAGISALSNAAFGGLGELARGRASVPERPETIKAQLDERGYSLIPTGTPRPSMPRGYRAEKTADGVVYYDPNRISRETIRNTPTTELLGHVEPKSETTTEAVVARTPEGTEIQSSAVSPENVGKQAEVMAAQYPEAKIETGGPELAADVIAERTAPQEFEHLQFGRVRVVADQTGARTGKLRVAEVVDPTKQHFVKKADLQGRGNSQMIPIKESAEVPTEPAATASPKQPPLAEAERSASQPETLRVEPETKGEPHVIPPATQKSEVVADSSVREGGDILSQSTPKSAEIPPAPSITSARKEMFTADRAELDLPELPVPERKAWQKTLDEAKAKGTQNAGMLADEVLAKPRALNDVETGQLVLRAQEIKNEHSRVMKEIGDASDPDVITSKRSQANAMEAEFDRLTRAAKASGSEKGRALASQKLTINQDFDLVSMVQRAKAARGRELKPEERSKIETQAKQIAELTQKLTDAEDRAKSAQLQREIDHVVRRGRRATTKAALDDEFAALKAQFAKAKAEIPRVQAAGLASLDPEGTLTKLIGKMAQNRVRAGTVQAEALVDEIYSAVREHVAEITKRDVRDAISGYGMEPKGDRRSEQAKQLAEIRSELKTLSAQEDIEAGKRLPPKDKTRQTQLLKQEAELRRRLTEKDFSRPEPRRTPKYTAETYRLQKQINEIKAEYEREHYKATRGVGGKIADTVAGVGNVPKTLLSMGDLSALLRQGGYGVVTHPILSSKAAVDMLKSMTERGFANVEAEIRDNPKFEEAKRNGVEFTGIDQADPRLSHKEEGYLGSNFIDTIAKGKANPLRVVKGVKDVSERTFVSFLDSQRMRLYDHQSNAIRGMGLTPEQTNAALKAQAKLINMATGRGNLGRQGNQAAPLLNVAMFSPRLLASRVQLLNKMFNPIAWARQPKGSRQLMMKDNAKFLAFTAVTLGLAKAAGLQVNTDSDDADFLKLKVGDTRYDHLTGLQQPMRFMLRMANAIKGGETYAGDTKSKILGDFARSKAAPGFGYVWDYTEGKNRLSGKRFEAGRDAAGNLIPLPMQDFAEAVKNDGALRGIVEAFPSLLGVGVQTYKGGAEKPTTHAEKLARRMMIRKMPEQARDQEQIDLDQAKADLRAKSRRGEDVSKELEALGAKITPRQAKNILDARDKSRLQEDMRSLGAKDAIILWSVMTPGQRAETRSLLEHKATLIDNLPDDEQLDVRKRYADAGIEAKSKEKKTGFKSAFGRGFKQRQVSP